MNAFAKYAEALREEDVAWCATTALNAPPAKDWTDTMFEELWKEVSAFKVPAIDSAIAAAKTFLAAYCSGSVSEIDLANSTEILIAYCSYQNGNVADIHSVDAAKDFPQAKPPTDIPQAKFRSLGSSAGVSAIRQLLTSGAAATVMDKSYVENWAKTLWTCLTGAEKEGKPRQAVNYLAFLALCCCRAMVKPCDSVDVAIMNNHSKRYLEFWGA